MNRKLISIDRDLYIMARNVFGPDYPSWHWTIPIDHDYMIKFMYDCAKIYQEDTSLFEEYDRLKKEDHNVRQ